MERRTMQVLDVRDMRSLKGGGTTSGEDTSGGGNPPPSPGDTPKDPGSGG